MKNLLRSVLQAIARGFRAWRESYLDLVPAKADTSISWEDGEQHFEGSEDPRISAELSQMSADVRELTDMRHQNQ